MADGLMHVLHAAKKPLVSVLPATAGPREDVQERSQLGNLHGGHASGSEQQDQEGFLRASDCSGQSLPGVCQAHHHPILWTLSAQPQ